MKKSVFGNYFTTFIFAIHLWMKLKKNLGELKKLRFNSKDRWLLCNSGTLLGGICFIGFRNKIKNKKKYKSIFQYQSFEYIIWVPCSIANYHLHLTHTPTLKEIDPHVNCFLYLLLFWCVRLKLFFDFCWFSVLSPSRVRLS